MELQEASLVIAEEAGEAMRFRMLETVREYAEERLTKCGEAEAIQARHRDWYLELAERAERELERSSSALWLDRLETERENLRAALVVLQGRFDRLPTGTAVCLKTTYQTYLEAPLVWCGAEESGTEAGLRLAGALGRFWEVCGYTSEGRSFLAEVLGRKAGSGARSVDPLRARGPAPRFAPPPPGPTVRRSIGRPGRSTRRAWRSISN